MPLYLLRLIEESLKIFLKDSSVNSSQLFVEKFSTADKGWNSVSDVGLENRFHGQTSWHTSQPKAQF